MTNNRTQMLFESEFKDESESNWNLKSDFFVGVFVNSRQYKTCTKTQLALMLALSRYCTLYSNCVDLSSSTRKSICRSMNIKVATFNNQFSALCKTDLIIKLVDSKYMLNPWLLYRGSNRSAQKARSKFDELLLKREEKWLSEI
ncbi:replication/maintenance protein RepL [Alteromonas sp. KUL42]|uniref:replication/maintenance protein RepL n=1 Tax=Alteromonas sp. KUL42 TaxID=2480797 RepID=UPI0013EFC2A3|nr:replication/maintenance protein RepL [Alteromonas sp. KUL42]